MTAMNKDSKIYVAGHNGLVGSAIMRGLKSRGYENIIVRNYEELDLTNQEQTNAFFREENPEFVFLAAAKVGGIVANSRYKADFIYDNIMIASNVIHASWKYGVSKLINLGSSCIYPKLAPQPLKEEYLLSGDLEETNDAYALAKIAAIKMCNSFNEQYGTNFVSAMPTNLYGPFDNFDLEKSHVLPAMIRKMFLGQCLHSGSIDELRRDLNKYPIEGVAGNADELDILNVLSKYGISLINDNVTITLWGDGSPMREFLYSEDLASAVIYLAEHVNQGDLKYGFVNVGTGTDLTINELSKIVKNVTGYEGNIEWDTSKPNGTPRKLMDVSLIEKQGWKHTVDIRSGIERMFSWYKSV